MAMELPEQHEQANLKQCPACLRTFDRLRRLSNHINKCSAVIEAYLLLGGSCCGEVIGTISCYRNHIFATHTSSKKKESHREQRKRMEVDATEYANGAYGLPDVVSEELIEISIEEGAFDEENPLCQLIKKTKSWLQQMV